MKSWGKTRGLGPRSWEFDSPHPDQRIIIKMFDDILKEEINHTGFCMSDYNEVKCIDCPTLVECLELYYKEKAEYSKQ